MTWMMIFGMYSFPFYLIGYRRSVRYRTEEEKVYVQDTGENIKKDMKI